MAEVVSCPSGLVVELRGLKVKDEDALAAAGVKGAFEGLNKLLESCIIGVQDPGMYKSFGKFMGDGKLDSLELLQGDRMALLVALRRVSYGDEMEFSVSCGVATCRTKYPWVINLSELPVKALPEESMRNLVDGGERANRFEVVLPAYGKKATVRILTGKEERNLMKVRQQKGGETLSSDVLRQRIIEIEGVNPAALPEFILDMEGADASRLRAFGEEIDCGVETTIETECRACRGSQAVELPLGENFLGRGGIAKKS